MKKFFLLLVLLIPSGRAEAALPVIDTASIVQLIQQVRQTLQVIGELKDLNKWEEIDHINLAGGKFGRFLSKYKDTLGKIVDEINGYQNGGAFGQIGRISGDEIYPGYHVDWEKKDELGDDWRNLKKQVLWTKIQMKHAAIVGAKVRDSLEDTADQRNGLLQDTLASPGVLHAIKIGNQITATVGKDLEKLNVQLGEFIQAYSAKELEDNYRKGLQANRLEEAFEKFGEYETSPTLPRNPVGAYK